MAMGFLFNKYFLIIGLIVILWFTGGMGFVMKNPMFIVFGVLALAVMAFGGKRR